MTTYGAMVLSQERAEIEDLFLYETNTVASLALIPIVKPAVSKQERFIECHDETGRSCG
jgi:hypothetical protein